MTKRREERIPAKLPVRVWGVDMNGMPFMQTAHAVDRGEDLVVADDVRQRAADQLRRPEQPRGRLIREEDRAVLTDAILDGANLKGALMPDGSVHE